MCYKPKYGKCKNCEAWGGGGYGKAKCERHPPSVFHKSAVMASWFAYIETAESDGCWDFIGEEIDD